MSQTIPGTPNADTLPGRAELPDEIYGDTGDDSLTGLSAGTGGTDRLFGEDGNDTLVTSGSGFGLLDGGEGNDSIVAGASGIDSGVGGAGNDTLIGDAGADYLTGDDYDIFGAGPSTSSGNDVIDGGDGDDVISGGPGNDTLAAGRSDTGPRDHDQVFGGDGNDVLALEGTPQFYAAPLLSSFLVNFLGMGPGSGFRAEVVDVEQLAFGVTAQDLANGAVPLTLVDWSAIYEGSSASGIGRAHFSYSDTVQGAAGAQEVAISIAALLANDFDPDGDTLTFDAILPVAGPGIAFFSVLRDAADIANAGYEPAEFPGGLLLAVLDNPLTAPLRFTYRTQMEANGFVELGSTATVTIEPVTAPPEALDDVVRGTIGGTIVIPFATLLANDRGVSVSDGAFFNDGTFMLSIDRSAELFYLTDYGTAARTVSFQYDAQDTDGTFYSASVQVTLANRVPVATDQTLYVQPGVANSFDWGPIVRAPGNADPDGDPVTLAFYNGSGTGPFGTLTGFGNNDLGGITFTPVADYAGGFSITYGIIDQPDLGGAQPTFPYPSATLRFEIAEPLEANADTIRWSFGKTGVLPVSVLLGNDGGSSLQLVSPGAGPADFVLTQLGRGFFGQEIVTGSGIPGVIGYEADPQAQAIPYQDEATYAVRDVLGNVAAATVTILVDNNAPDAGDFALTLSPGEVITLEMLEDATVDADGDAVRHTGFGNFLGSFETVLDPVTNETLGYRVSPDVGGSAGSFVYFMEDDSGAGGNTDLGLITVTFAPTVYRLTGSGLTVEEGTGNDGQYFFTITRSGVLDQATILFSIAPALAGDSAEEDDTRGGFVQNTLAQYTFAADQAEAQFLILVAGDTLDEADEGFIVTLDGVESSNPGAIDPRNALIEVTILDDDAPGTGVVHFEAPAAATTAEGDNPGVALGGELNYRLVRSGDLSGSATVTFALGGALSGNPATSDDVGLVADGGDSLGSGFGHYTATFDPGQDVAFITVFARGDVLPEADEGIQLTLLSATGATLSTTQALTATGTILNDDIYPEIALSAASAGTSPEGDAIGGPLQFVITRTGDLAYASVVTFSVGAGSGGTTADDVATVADGGTGLGAGFGNFAISFNPGETERTITVIAAPDTVPENDDGIVLTLLSATEGTLSSAGPLSATGTFTNDDVYPDIALSSASAGSVPEGNAIGGQLQFVITRTGDLAYETVVTFSVGAGSGGTTADDIATVADGGTGLGAGFGTFAISFNPGDTERTITVIAAPDTVPENDEGIVLTLLSATEGTLSSAGPLSATGTFTNDDVYPDIALSSASAGTSPEGDAIGGQLQFVITRTGDLAYASVVTFTVGAGSGGTTADDVATVADGGTGLGSGFGTFAITFAAGETQRFINVISTADTVPEQDEHVVLTLLTASEGKLSPTGPLSATGTFVNDDMGNQAPDGIALSDLRVASYLPPGSLVAQITATDPDAGDSASLSFAPGGNPRGFFAIDGDALETARPLPFTNGALLSVTLRATDLAGAIHDETFVIEVGRDRSGTPAVDRIVGRNSDDRLSGLDGNDVLLGRDGDDLLQGGPGDDFLAGGEGADTLEGDAGNDRMLGGAGEDAIAGGAGSDAISAGEGADTVTGGDDDGTALLRGPTGAQQVVLSNPDYIDLRRPGSTLPDGAADLLLYAVGTDGVDLVRGFEAGRDMIRIALHGDTLAVREVTNGTWIGFGTDPGGVLLLGATGLLLGTDIVIA